jgi:hypothetical protein
MCGLAIPPVPTTNILKTAAKTVLLNLTLETDEKLTVADVMSTRDGVVGVVEDS